MKVYTFWGTESYAGKSLDIKAYDCLYGYFVDQKLAEIFKTIEKTNKYHWRIYAAGAICSNLYGLTGRGKSMKACRAAILNLLHANGFRKMDPKTLVMK